jgi:hypothetical protein
VRRDTAAVKDGRRPSPQAAHSVLDGCEHDATLDQVGTYDTSCRVMVLSAVCQISLMPAASGPFRPSTTSTATRWPSARPVIPAR